MKFRTRAKTAYGLLSEVRKLILEEPKRYNQRDILEIRDTKDPDNNSYTEYPNCGTVGCVAGWVTVLKAARPSRVQNVLGYAGKVLGLSDEQRNRLVHENAAGTFTQRQSQEHAEAGAAHIRLFQQDYAAQLKRTKI